MSNAPPGAVEALRFNPNNPITEGIWRVAHGEGTAIRKVIAAGAPTHRDWEASGDPRHWLYWRREADFYASDVPARLGDGLRAPELYALTERDDGAVELLLEDVAGRTGGELTWADLERACEGAGRVQARMWAEPVEAPWASQRALRQHCASKHVDAALLTSDAAWGHPLVRDTWPAGLRAGLERLHDQRERLFTLAEAAPRTFAHLDLWSHNLMVSSEEVVVIDWAFSGEGALGEDLANLLAEAGLDLLVPAGDLRALERRLLPAYLRGLAEGGFDGDPRWVRLGYLASAVKWHWLGALHLERAQTGGHHLYGGRDDPDPAHQYRERGAVLGWLVEHADEALALGDALGVSTG